MFFDIRERDRHAVRRAALLVPRDHVEEVAHGAARVVGERARVGVAHPAMDTTPPGVDPEDVFVPEVTPKSRVEHLHRDGHERPALAADRRAAAART